MLATAKHKTRRQLGVVGICFALMMGVSACTLSEGGMYKVTTGYGVYMNIFQVPTAYISRFLFVNACGGDYTCTGWYLHDHIKISGWGAAEWEQATREQGSQQKLAIYLYSINIHSPQTMYDVRAGGNCLVLVKDFGLFSSSLHWEELGQNSSDCQRGTDPSVSDAVSASGKAALP
jgi:hypothetical protein